MEIEKEVKIYSKFFAKDLNSDDLVEYQIQDLTEEYFDYCIELYAKDLLMEEIIYKASGIDKDPVAIEIMRDFMRKIYEKKHSLVCLRSDTKEIVGCNGLYVKSRGEQAFGVKIIKILKNKSTIFFTASSSAHKRFHSIHRRHRQTIQFTRSFWSR